MDPRNFVSSAFGEPKREPGNKWAFWYYEPRSVPRQIQLEPDTVVALSRADAALGQLSGVSLLLPDPELFIGPSLTREAVASSRIEGTQASLSDVLQAELAGDQPTSEDVAEVYKYLEASQMAFALIEELPISQRLLLEVHRTLLTGVRGEEKNPGEFRRSAVWVGPPGVTPDEAIFVPPLPTAVPDLIADWERYVNEENGTPDLVRAAIMHYQFETIHPFLDGNGRIGRLAVNLLLKQRNRLKYPLLYLSGYLESHRDEYYARLQAVREKGEVQEWLVFFLEAVRAQAEDGIWRAGRLIQLREQYLRAAATTRSRLPTLVETIFRNPFITVRRIQQATGLTNAGARNLVRQAESLEWVTSLGRHGRGGQEIWYAKEIFAIQDAPVRY